LKLKKGNLIREEILKWGLTDAIATLRTTELKKLNNNNMNKNKNSISDIKNNHIPSINNVKSWTIIRHIISTVIITILTARALTVTIQILQNKSQSNDNLFFKNISKFQISNILKNLFHYEKIKIIIQKSLLLSQLTSQFRSNLENIINYTGDILGDMGIIDLIQKIANLFKFTITSYSSKATPITFLQNQNGIMIQQLLILIGIIMSPLFLWLRILKSINDSLQALGNVILVGNSFPQPYRNKLLPLSLQKTTEDTQIFNSGDNNRWWDEKISESSKDHSTLLEVCTPVYMCIACHCD
jgi:hypothetical protein